MSTIKGSSKTGCAASVGLKTVFACRVVILLLVIPGLLLPGTGFAQPRPTWVSSARMTTGDGFATLRWSVEGSDPIALFRIREEHSSEHQISFTDQAEIRVFRIEPGDYIFWVQACKRYLDGYPLCGEPSPQLILVVFGDSQVGAAD